MMRLAGIRILLCVVLLLSLAGGDCARVALRVGSSASADAHSLQAAFLQVENSTTTMPANGSIDVELQLAAEEFAGVANCHVLLRILASGARLRCAVVVISFLFLFTIPFNACVCLVVDLALAIV